MADYIRGIATGDFDGYGLIQSLEFSGEADEDTAKNKTGITAYHEVFDARVEATATIRFDRDATLPETGAVIELSQTPNAAYDGNYKVLSPPTISESNEAGPSVVINLRRYIDGEIPAIES